LLLISSHSHPYFIWNFWSLVSPPFNQISLNSFELIRINAKRCCFSRLDPPFPSQTAHTLTRGPSACAQPTLAARSPAPARRQTPPDGVRPRHSRRRELSPTGLHTTPTSPPMNRIGKGVRLRALEPLLPPLRPTEITAFSNCSPPQ
jgi:hypothetical protein